MQSCIKVHLQESVSTIRRIIQELVWFHLHLNIVVNDSLIPTLKEEEEKGPSFNNLCMCLAHETL